MVGLIPEEGIRLPIDRHAVIGVHARLIAAWRAAYRVRTQEGAGVACPVRIVSTLVRRASPLIVWPRGLTLVRWTVAA
jgi:hypothetical protein